MPLTHIVRNIYRSSFLRELYAGDSWMPLAEDVSGLIASDGKTIYNPRMPNPGITLNNYTRGQELTFQDITPGMANFSLDQEKYFAHEFDRVDMRQAFVDAVSNAAMWDARAVVRDINNHLRDTFETASTTTTAYDVATNPAGPAPAAINVAGGPNATPLNSDTLREGLVDALINLHTDLDRRGWLENGRRPFIVMDPAIRDALAKFLIIDHPNLGAGARVDNAFMDVAVGNVLGYDIVIDRQIPQTFRTGAAAGKFPMYVGMRGESISLARQINLTEMVPHPLKFGIILKGLSVYGAHCWINEKCQKVSFTLT